MLLRYGKMELYAQVGQVGDRTSAVVSGPHALEPAL